MRFLAKTALVLLGLAALLVGISFNVLRAQDLGAPRDAASRAMATDVRQATADITAIKLDGPIDLTLRQGATPSLTVYAEQRLMPNIVTQQEGSTMRISTKGLLLNVRRPIRIEMTLPTLASLQVSGSGDARVTGFTGEAMQLALQGSGDVNFDGKYRKLDGALSGSGDLVFDGGTMESIELRQQGSGDASLRGTARRLALRIQGSGDFKGDDLKVEAVDVALMGSGDAHVNARSAVTVNLNGSGDVHVSGNPQTRSVNRHGSGEVYFD